MQVAILEAATQEPLPGFGLANSSIGGQAPNQCTTTRFDRTRAPVTWQGSATVGVAVKAGQAVRLRFRFNGASLFSFWFSQTRLCGVSQGFMAAGGPGAKRGIDVAGSCIPKGQ